MKRQSQTTNKPIPVICQWFNGLSARACARRAPHQTSATITRSQLGHVPRTEVLFAETSDALGPFGAKSMSESPYNPILAAIGNALFDATGIRFCQMPVKPDRLFAAIAEKFGTGE
jgi:hypothetical protein